MDKKRLRELAEKATPGPWDFDTGVTPYKVEGGDVVGGDCTGFGEVFTKYDVQLDVDIAEPAVVANDVKKVNGRFIAAADPATILALLDEIDSLNSTIKNLEKC